MLFNPKWDFRSIDSLIAWLETQSGEYTYKNARSCLLAQYLLAQGKERVIVSVDNWFWGGMDGEKIPPGFNRIALQWPRTFEAALTRARAYKSKDSDAADIESLLIDPALGVSQ